MNKLTTHAPDALVEAIQEGSAVFVVGAGISMAVAELPSWTSLVLSAAEHARSVGLFKDSQVDHIRSQIDASISAGDLIAIADDITGVLKGHHGGSGEFSRWLEDTFSNRSIVNGARLLSAIERASSRTILTTNFDTVLEAAFPSLPSVDWTKSSRFALSARRSPGIYHLHGVWLYPDTVILGESDYLKLHTSSSYLDTIKALWLSKTLVFVGCSLNGVTDPDFIRLLDWSSRLFSDRPYRHYLLGRSGLFSEEDKELFLNRWRLQLVEFGAEHQDLPGFIEGLAPAPDTKLPPIPRTLYGRRDELEVLTSHVGAGSSCQVNGVGGIGKTTLVASAIRSPQLASKCVVWIEVSEMDSEGIALGVLRSLVARGVISGHKTTESALVELLRKSSDISNLVVALDVDGPVGSTTQFLNDISGMNIPVLVSSRERTPSIPNVVQLGELRTEDALEMFRAVSGVQIETTDAQQFCELVGNHPLAIKLAASRCLVESLPPSELLRRLRTAESKLIALRDPETAGSRQTSVDFCLAASIDPLPVDMQRILAAIASEDTAPTEELVARVWGLLPDMIQDWVGGLIRRSLVERTINGRLRCHRLVTDYISARLPDMRQQYLFDETRFITTTVRNYELEPELPSLVATDLPRFLSFIHNLTAESSSDETVAGLVLGALLFSDEGILQRYHLLDEFRDLQNGAIDRLVNLADIEGNEEPSVFLLVSAAHTSLRANDLARARILLKRAETLSNRVPDGGLTQARVGIAQGNAFLTEQRPDLAERLFAKVRLITQDSGDVGFDAQATGQHALSLKLQRQFSESETLYKEAIRKYESIGQLTGVAACESNLADIAMAKGEQTAAWSLHLASYEHERQAEQYAGAISSLEALSKICATSSQFTQREQIVDEFRLECPEVIERNSPGIFEVLLGVGSMNAGHVVQAYRYLTRAVDIRSARGTPRSLANVYRMLGELRRKQGLFANCLDYWSKAEMRFVEARSYDDAASVSMDALKVAVEKHDMAEIISWACVAIAHSCVVSDMRTAALAYMSLVPFAASNSSPMPGISACNGGLEHLTFQQAVHGLHVAANKRDLKEIERLIICITSKWDQAGNLTSYQ